MKITYIHHSSFLVEMKQAALLFDYTRGELSLPGGKPVIIFASHRHGDHFSPVIFDLAQGRQDVYYVISSDIQKKRTFPESDSRMIFPDPGQEFALPWLPDIRIRTFKSTDEGVAFLIFTSEGVIYHAGDLNNWQWEGEPKDWNRNMEVNYHRQLEAMKGAKIDVAFVPLDPRQGKDFFRGMDDFMKTVGALRVFPMHCWGDFSVIGRLKGMETSEEYRDRIEEIQEDGQVFAYE